MVTTHQMEFEMESASLHPEGDKFVAGGEDMWVRLYDFNTGGELGECRARIARLFEGTINSGVVHVQNTHMRFRV